MARHAVTVINLYCLALFDYFLNGFFQIFSLDMENVMDKTRFCLVFIDENS